MKSLLRPTATFSTPLALLAISLPLLLTACSRDEAPTVVDTPRPVKTLVVEAPLAGGFRQFPARIDALNKAEMAFRIPGSIQELAVKEGDPVEAGQLLLTLDPTDYEIAAKDAQATFNRADREFRRAQELIENGYISQSDFDLKEAQWKNASAAVEKTIQDLAYTRLTAPFDGTVAERYVQQFEEVQAKQPVLAIQDNRELEVQIDVPEVIVSQIRPTADRRPQPDLIPVFASFENRPGEKYDLELREVATRADASTQTFQVTFIMPAPSDFLVFPGMTATVTADMSNVATNDQTVAIPASAVTADEGLEPFVWTVDEPALTVRKTPVAVGRLFGHSIEIEDGLNPGIRVVTAGVGYLAEGMTVRLMEQREEAEPRPDEAPPSPTGNTDKPQES